MSTTNNCTSNTMRPPRPPNMTSATTATSSSTTTLPPVSSTWGKNNIDWQRIPTDITCFTQINSSSCFLLLKFDFPGRSVRLHFCHWSPCGQKAVSFVWYDDKNVMAWRRALQIKMNRNDNGCMVISVLKKAIFFSFPRSEEQSCTEKFILGVEYLNPSIPYFWE